VTEKTPETAQYAAVPRWLTFSNIHLDGTYMGWQGNVQETTFENIYSARYGDLQDANGGTVGGIGKWFPPPHLFYLNTRVADPLLLNTEYHDILRDGPRTPRRRGARYGIERYQRLRQFAQAELHDMFGRQLHKPSTRRLHGSSAFIRADGVQCLCVVQLGISQ
jgi:hypothetical protein